MWEFLHPRLVEVSRPIANAGKFDDAIFAAFRYVEAEIQERICSKSIGQALLDEAFGGNDPLIKISSDSRDQKGVREIFSGALSNIRNDRGHKKAPLLPCNSEEECFLYLGFANFLLYLLRKDSNKFPAIDAFKLFGTYDHPRAELQGRNFGHEVRVFADFQEATITYRSDDKIEILLPPRSSGKLKVVADGNESNHVPFDSDLLQRKNVGQSWEVISVNIPLFTDADCSQERTDIIGIMVKVTDPTGLEERRVLPVRPGSYQAGYYVKLDWDTSTPVGPAYFRNQVTGEKTCSWIDCALVTSTEICRAGQFMLGNIALLPVQVEMQAGECRPLRVIGTGKDGLILKHVDLTARVTWSADGENVAVVRNGVVYGKSLGNTTIGCRYQGIAASAEVMVAHFPRGHRVTYLEGLPGVHSVAIDREDNVFLGTAARVVYKFSRARGLEEVIRIPAPHLMIDPIKIVVDQAGNLMCTMREYRGSCQIFPWDGTRFGAPERIVVLPDGRITGLAAAGGKIYVTAEAFKRGVLVQVESNGSYSSSALNIVSTGLAAGTNGVLYLATDREPDRPILLLDPEGKQVGVIPQPTDDSPNDIAVDPAGGILLLFGRKGKVVRLHPQREEPTEYRGFKFPTSIAVDSKGRAFVVDAGSETVYMLY